jgi:heme-degrading monooxygenase HmoA
MYMRVTQGRIRQGEWKAFEAAYKRVTEPHVAGLKFLLSDVNSEDSGHSMSLWESLDALRAYETGDLLRDVIEPALRPFYTEDYTTYVSEVVDQR